MSRVGKQPIPVPTGVDVKIDGQVVRVSGPKGELLHELPEIIKASLEDGKIAVTRRDDERKSRALHGLSRNLVANLVVGVTEGYSVTLELHGTGYRASKSGQNLVLQVGFSHPVEIEPPQGVELEVPNPTTVVVKGVDKQQVGQVAANIRAVRSPEPYLGKGIRYSGERIRRKEGKAGKK